MNALRKTLEYTQQNKGEARQVFSLLCPVREKDWLDGWEYHMVWSRSGLVERGCVFTTPHHGSADTVWYVTKHDPEALNVEFVRVTPGEMVVRIAIELQPVSQTETTVHITYEYTALNSESAKFLELEAADAFEASMQWWERAINHYLVTGEMLRR